MSALRELAHWLKEFDAMGNAVQDQFYDLVDGGSIADQNPNALAMIEEWLEHAPDLGDAINEEVQDLVSQLEAGGADDEEEEAGEDEYAGEDDHPEEGSKGERKPFMQFPYGLGEIKRGDPIEKAVDDLLG